MARRRNLGWGALAAAVVLLGVLVWTGVDPWWRLFVFFPVMMSASGFLQAQFQFCTGFAHRGVFNFGSLGQSQAVTDPSAGSKDRKRGNQIMLYAVLIGIAAALLSLLA